MEQFNCTRKRVIGGEFEINSLPYITNKDVNQLKQGESGTWTTNGRSALYLILQKLKQGGVNHIHLPAFLCKSILQPVLELGLDYSFYPVKLDLTAVPDPSWGSAVLLIHYYGFINGATDALRASTGKEFQLIEDASHVFLNDNYFHEAENQCVFFSARKHGPTALGGWCNLALDLRDPDKDIEVCAWKSLTTRLIKAMYLYDDHGEIDPIVENYYLSSFREAEKLFDSGVQLTDLPHIIVKIINNIRWDNVSIIRRTNWKTLHDLIKDKTESIIDNLPDGVVPLGYVIRLKNRDAVREKLAAHRIYAPVHWSLPDEIDRQVFPDSAKLADSLLTLPIDQRYSYEDMNYIADVIGNIL